MTTSEMGGARQPGQDLGAAGRNEDRSIGEILSDVTADLSTLMRQELELAKAEVKQTASRAGTGAGLFGGAAIAGHMVLLFLSIALWWGLGMLIGHAWSALIVAVIWGIIAAVLAVNGRKQLARVKGVPQTTETVAKIPDALKGNDTTVPPPPGQTVGGATAGGASSTEAVGTYPDANHPAQTYAGPSYPAPVGPTYPAAAGQNYPASHDYPGNGQETYR